ncbi:MAG: HEAT repeat domain-containing protein [Nanoarchaeota archaeon]
MIHDPAMQNCLAQLSGIAKRVTGDTVHDYRLIYGLKKELQRKQKNQRDDKKAYAREDKAHLGLAYLLLFHPSSLVRHEAAFVLGEYGRTYSSFLRASALLDPETIVRHEATLALSARSQRGLAFRNKFLLEYIATHDESRMVRDTARVSLDNL